MTQRINTATIGADRSWSDEQARFLAAAGAALNAPLDYEQVLARLAGLAVPYLADWCSIALAEPYRPPRRVVIACADPALRPLADAIARFELAPDTPYSYAHVIATGVTERIEVYPADFFDHLPADPGYCALMKQVNPRSTLTVPLNVRGQTRGAIAYTMAESGRYHSPEQIALAEELACRAAVAVDNALLYRDTQRRLAELTTVQRVAQAISRARGLDQICQTIVEQVSLAFGYKLVSIYLREGELLFLQAVVGYDQVLRVIRLDQGVCGRVVRTGEACFVRDAHQDPDFLHAVPHIRQGIFVPLSYADGPTLGLIAVESTGSPLLTNDDLSLLSLLADQISVAVINARLFAQAEESANRWQALVAATGSVVICLDLELRITEFNREAEHVFGCPRDNALGLDYLSHFVSPADRAALAAMAAAAVADTPLRPLEMIVADQDGNERSFFWTITCRRDAAGVPAELLVVGHDITERRHAEEARLAVERKMYEAQRLESLGVLAGGIAHDFNNLLAAILGNANLLLLDVPPGSEAHYSARQIELVSQRAADLVGQMLAYAGRGRFNLQPLNLNTLVAEMTVLLRVSISKGACLIQHLGHDLPAVEADPAQIRQVLMNLIVNASEAIGEHGGTITITTDLQHIGPDDLADAPVGNDIRSGTYVTLTVRDTGSGMDDATRARIFDPFFTTKFTGRGLGLAAVLGIVRSHRGALLVSSQPGQGSTFTVLLPQGAAAPGMASVTADALLKPQPAREGHLILVIDDEDDVRRMVVRIIERGGYLVVSATDGESGLALSRSLSQPLAAVVLDLTMPRISGEEVFRELRRDRPELPVLLMSGYTPEEISARFPDDTPAAMLQKPFSARELLDLLSSMVQRYA